MQSDDWTFSDSDRIVNVKYLTELIGFKTTLLLICSEWFDVKSLHCYLGWRNEYGLGCLTVYLLWSTIRMAAFWLKAKQ